jgi:hypothetical protein
MSKNAMAGAVTLCGVGLCMIGGAMLMQSGGQAHAAPSSLPAAAAAVSSIASAQAGGEPTVVWYGMAADAVGNKLDRLYRAWSDGTIEMKHVWFDWDSSSASMVCQTTYVQCTSPWIVISSPNQGFKAAADINADELVDGADLASVLSNWGDAPRVPFPPSDCPLNLINP